MLQRIKTNFMVVLPLGTIAFLTDFPTLPQPATEGFFNHAERSACYSVTKFEGEKSPAIKERMRQTQRLAEYLQPQVPTWSYDKLCNFSQFVLRTSSKYGIPHQMVVAIMAVESGFQEDVVSNQRAVGIMQVKYSTAKPIAGALALTLDQEDHLKEPRVNVLVGVHYLAELRRRFGNEKAFLTAYNIGPTRMDRIIDGKEEASATIYNYYEKVRAQRTRYMNFQRGMAAASNTYAGNRQI